MTVHSVETPWIFKLYDQAQHQPSPLNQGQPKLIA
jgi:hypothetical protein